MIEKIDDKILYYHCYTLEDIKSAVEWLKEQSDYVNDFNLVYMDGKYIYLFNIKRKIKPMNKQDLKKLLRLK